jgi:hypothetical protein
MRSTKRHITVMTSTSELFLPTRLVYEVHSAPQLRARIEKFPGMAWNPEKRCWAWSYEGAVRALEFPPEYRQAPAKLQPVVLASCYLVDDRTFHVYTRCGFRTVKFLGFFDQQVSRSIAVGKFIDQYNLITTIAPGDPAPVPEEYFKDETRIEFFDLIGLMDSPDSPAKKQMLAAYQAGAATRTLRPLERHRLDLFYHDGSVEMERAMRLRDMLATVQHQSDKPIRPVEVITRLLSGGGNVFPREDSKGGMRR